MIDHGVHPPRTQTVEAVMRAELAHGDAMAGTILPILRHLISAEDNSVFSDEILARVRGMLSSLAISLLDTVSAAGGQAGYGGHSAPLTNELTNALMESEALLTHLHCSALEWQLTERLQARLALDPVVSPLVQALIASPDSATQGLAMAFLAAQARWCQAQRRMELTLTEMPAELFHGALIALRRVCDGDFDMEGQAARAEQALRDRYEEASTRLGLAGRLVMSMGSGALAALAVGHAGVPLFITALAMNSGQERDPVVLSTHESQLARFALALRAAGQKPGLIEEQFLTLHPDITMPAGFDRLGVDLAASILTSGRYTG